MPIKLKKTKKSKKIHGTTTYGWGARKKHKGSGHRGGKGMAGTGKRADQKKSLVIRLYGNKYFGKQGITSKRTAKKKQKVINLHDIEEKFKEGEIDLKEYKILGGGEISRKFIIKAKSFSKSAKEKIEKAGGEIAVEKKEKKTKEDKTKKLNNKQK